MSTRDLDIVGAGEENEFASYRPVPFERAWWLRGVHAQTVGGRQLRRYDREPLRSERIELPDGDFVDLDEGPESLPEDAPVVLALHGLEGCSGSNYMSTVARELAAVGIRTLRLNFRGCSGEMNRLARFYHAGDTGDVAFVANLLWERHASRPMGLVGFSLGGNVLLKYLGEQGDEARQRFRSAAAVSVPFDLVEGTRKLERGVMGRLYTLYFIRKLRRKMRAKREMLRNLCDVDAALAAWTIRAYDEAATAQLHDFESAWHYYESSSAKHLMHRIRTLTLVIHAMDDPFLPSTAVPVEAVRENPWLIDAITPNGGHVGFVTGSPFRPVFWAEREVARFMAATLKAR
ncbi:MAG: alpha/beta fold hydrolase [Gemmatimonas sp.]|nr:alpha/beta fold hydrolase [Gemmatimonas sp.]